LTDIHRSPHLPSSLTRRRVLEGAGALAISALLQGCSSGSLSGGGNTPFPAANPQPTPSGTITGASVIVGSGVVGSIAPGFVGLSFEKNRLQNRYFSAANTNLIGLFKRLGPSIMRIGGSSVDATAWTPAGKGSTTLQIAPSDIDALAAFVKATGWQCLYGINLKGLEAGATVPTTTALGAAEIAYAAQAFGTSLMGVELGNEPDEYGFWTVTQFETAWDSMRTAILASTPNVVITGPDAAANVPNWTVPFSQWATESKISLLTEHYYTGSGTSPTSTAAALLTYPDPLLTGPKFLGGLQPAAANIGVPYRMTECNSFNLGGSPGVSDSYASALWAIDYLFTCAQFGASGVNFHSGGDGNSYTSIADDYVNTVIGVRPEYYGMLLFTLAGTGPLNMTTVSAGSLNVSAYAVQTASGGMNIVIVNKDSTNNLQVTIQLPKSTPSASLLEMTQLSTGATGPSLAAVPTSLTSGDQSAGVSIQGAEVGVDGTFGVPVLNSAGGTLYSSYPEAYTITANKSELTCYVPALSAVLIQTV